MSSPDSSTAVTEYSEESKKQLFLAGINARIAIEEWKSGKKPDFSFTKEHKGSLAGMYELARSSLAENGSDLHRLKDAHAFWLSSIDDLLPRSDEPTSAYEARLSERQFRFSVLANRLTLL